MINSFYINKFQIQNNSVKSFFLRIILILCIMMFFAVISTYYYLEYTKALEVDLKVRDFINKFEQENELNTNTKNGNILLDNRSIKEFISTEPSLLRFEVLNEKGMLYFHYQRRSFDTTLEKVFNEIKTTKNQQYNYKLVQHSNEKDVLIYTKILPQNNLLIKVAMQLDEDIINNIKKTMNLNKFIAALVIVFLVIIIFFPIVYTQFKKLNKSRVALLHANMDMLKVLGNTIALRDSDTSLHNYRVVFYSVRLAEKMKLSHECFPALIKGSFLHDIGKIGISDTILLKPAKLDKNEFEIMKTHTKLGLKIVDKIEWLKDASIIIGSHHEKFNGNGYPQSLKEDEIPLIARIFSVIDVFDALMSKRPYKESMSYEECMEIIHSDIEKSFCPEVVFHFKSIAKELWMQTKDLDEKELSELLVQIIKPYYKLL